MLVVQNKFSLFQIEGGDLEPLKEKSYPHQKIINPYGDSGCLHTKELPRIDGVCLGVAGPVTQGKSICNPKFSWAHRQAKKLVRNYISVPFL